MENGSIVIVVLPQADGVPKNRPALVLCRLEPFGDYLVAGISSQLHRTIENTDEIIAESDPDFANTRLAKTSVIRILYLATLPASEIKGKIGAVSQKRLRRIYHALQRHFATLQPDASDEQV